MSESQPTPPESTMTATIASKQTLPSIITVENAVLTKDSTLREKIKPRLLNAASSEEEEEPEGTFGQGRTPKHANKTDQPRRPRVRTEAKPQNLSHQFKSESHNDLRYQEQPLSEQTADRSAYGFAPTPRSYGDGRPFGECSAFHLHDSRQSSSRADYYGPPPPMQVSPGRGSGGDYRYYDHPQRNDFHNRFQPQPVPRFSEHSRGGYQIEAYHGPPPRYDGSFVPRCPPPHHQFNSYAGHMPQGSFNSGHNAPPPFHERYGAPQAYVHHGRPPPYPDHSRERLTNPMEGRYGPSDSHVVGHGNNTNFSRAVSSSFDRSVKSRSSDGDLIVKQDKNPIDPTSPSIGAHHAGYLADDSSWRQLNQVTSVDEGAIQNRIDNVPKTRATPPTPDDDAPHRHHSNHASSSPHPRSTSSSLTNSPTENHNPGAERSQSLLEDPTKSGPPIPTPSKLASLDSLSSVASAQEPIEELPKTSMPPTSPGSSTTSIDLMKCSSGSAGLLNLPHHGRDTSMETLPSYRLERKRSREDRGDLDTTTTASCGGDDELRRAPSEYDMKDIVKLDVPPFKKSRRDEAKPPVSDLEHKSSEPVSPSHSPTGRKLQRQGVPQPLSSGSSRTQHPQPVYARRSTSVDCYDGNGVGSSNSFFDKGPSYTYSMDSAVSLPRENYHRHSYHPPDSSSSTATPLPAGTEQIDGSLLHHEPSHRDGIGNSLPSWEIHAQDSFGGGSTGGGPLMSTFSFSHDCPMLSSSESNIGYNGEHLATTVTGAPPLHHRHESNPTLESRNQSFEGGHYHGSFSRTESMDMSYSRHSDTPQAPLYMDTYKPPPPGPFPPHAPSWGTSSSGAASYHGHPSGPPPPPPPPMPPLIQYRRGPPPYGTSPMMRSFSEDNSGRVSPPQGPPPPHRMMPGARQGFQPPPEFVAPHNPHLNRRPPPAVYIMSNSSNSHTTGKRGPGAFSWSKDDDNRLTDIMKKYKNPRDWEPIAKEHGRGKTAKECHERWIRYLKPGVRKGQWTDHEDAIVIEAVTTSSEQPFTRWSDLAQRLPGRVGKQIRDRWVNHLNPHINHLPFSREDDLLLWEGHKKVGKRWVEISTKFFNSSRSENHIKNRWYSASFKKFICNEFGPDAYSGVKGDDKRGKNSAEDDDDDEGSTIEAV